MSEKRFIRKNGKIIPIGGGKRKDGGKDLRKKGSKKGMTFGGDKSTTGKIFKKHGRESTTKERFKLGASMGVFGAIMGAQAGAIAGIIGNKKVGKSAAIGAAAFGGLMGLIGSSKQRVMSNRKFNKELGKELSRKEKSLAKMSSNKN